MNKKIRNIFITGLGLLLMPAANAASWGVEYLGYGGTYFPCGPGLYVADPVFNIYTSTEPSDWPAYSEFGHDLSYPGYSPFYSDSTSNNSSGVYLGRVGSVPALGAPFALIEVESHHWGIYNGTYVEVWESASGFSSGCYPL